MASGESIRKRIELLPASAALAVAGRAAWRVMPVMACVPDSENKAPFWFWPDDAYKHLYAIDIAVTITLRSASLTSQLRISDAEREIASAAHAVAVLAANANAHAAVAVYAARYAIAAAVSHGADIVATVVAGGGGDAGLYAAAVYDTASRAAASVAAASAVENDLQYLEKLQLGSRGEQGKPVPDDFFARPLWEGAEKPPSSIWDTLVEQWSKALEELELGDIANRYHAACIGRAIDWNEAKQRIDRWYETVDKQDGVKPVDPINVGGTVVTRPDKSTTIDELGREPLVGVLSGMLTHDKQPTPLTIALFADWGAGKSSVLDQLEAQIKKSKPDYIFAKFDAWEYERVDDIQAGMAQAIVTGLTKGLWFCWGKPKLALKFALSEHKWGLFKLFFPVLIVILVVVRNVGFAEFVDILGSKDNWPITVAGLVAFLVYLWKYFSPIWEAPVWREIHFYVKLPDYRKQLGQVPILKQHLKLLCRFRGVGTDDSNEKRLLIYVDNLDRCESAIIVQMLDAIRLVVDDSQKGVIVVIAVDPKIVIKAVREQYPKETREYLSKLIQMPIQLPDPTDEEMRGFVAKVLFPDVKEVDAPDPISPVIKKTTSVVKSTDKDPDAVLEPQPDLINFDETRRRSQLFSSSMPMYFLYRHS